MKLAVIHFMPLEYYPPVTNFLNFICGKAKQRTRVWSCSNIKNRNTYQKNKIHIIRTSFPDVNQFLLIRLMKYWIFNINTLLGLIAYRPDNLLYFESFSVWPVYVYLKYVNHTSSLFIHYHEYSSPEWYAHGMRLVKWYHKFEKQYLFKRACWISQTNKNRKDFFLTDHNAIDWRKLFILPNYPPGSWRHNNNRISTKYKEVLQLVYVGSLSLKDTYIEEICSWVILQNGKVNLDIYSYNLHEDTRYSNSLLVSL